MTTKYKPSWGLLSSPEELATLRQEYESGMTAQELADKYGCHKQHIYNRLQQAGAKMRRRALTRPRKMVEGDL